MRITDVPGTVTLAPEVQAWVFKFSAEQKLNEMKCVEILVSATGQDDGATEDVTSIAEQLYWLKRGNLLTAIANVLGSRQESSSTLRFEMRSRNAIEKLVDALVLLKNDIEIRQCLGVIGSLHCRESEFSREEIHVLIRGYKTIMSKMQSDSRSSHYRSNESLIASGLLFILIDSLLSSPVDFSPQCYSSDELATCPSIAAEMSLLGLVNHTISPGIQNGVRLSASTIPLLKTYLSIWSESGRIVDAIGNFALRLCGAYMDNVFLFHEGSTHIEPFETFWPILQFLCEKIPEFGSRCWASPHVSSFFEHSIEHLALDSEEFTSFFKLLKALCQAGTPDEVNSLIQNSAHHRWDLNFGTMHHFGSTHIGYLDRTAGDSYSTGLGSGSHAHYFQDRQRENQDLGRSASLQTTDVISIERMAVMLELIEELCRHESTRTYFETHQDLEMDLLLSDLIYADFNIDMGEEARYGSDRDMMACKMRLKAAALGVLTQYLEGETDASKLAYSWVTTQDALLSRELGTRSCSSFSEQKLSLFLHDVLLPLLKEDIEAAGELTVAYVKYLCMVCRLEPVMQNAAKSLKLHIRFFLTDIMLPLDPELGNWELLRVCLELIFNNLISIDIDELLAYSIDEFSDVRSEVLKVVFFGSNFYEWYCKAVKFIANAKDFANATGDQSLLACVEQCLAMFCLIANIGRRSVTSLSVSANFFPIARVLLHSADFLLAIAEILSYNPHPMVTFLCLTVFKYVEDPQSVWVLFKSQKAFPALLGSLSEILEDFRTTRVKPLNKGLAKPLSKLEYMEFLDPEFEYSLIERGVIGRNVVDMLIHHLDSGVPNIATEVLGFSFVGSGIRAKLQSFSVETSCMQLVFHLCTRRVVVLDCPRFAVSLLEMFVKLLEIPALKERLVSVIWDTQPFIFVDILQQIITQGVPRSANFELGALNRALIGNALKCISLFYRPEGRVIGLLRGLGVVGEFSEFSDAASRELTLVRQVNGSGLLVDLLEYIRCDKLTHAPPVDERILSKINWQPCLLASFGVDSLKTWNVPRLVGLLFGKVTDEELKATAKQAIVWNMSVAVRRSSQFALESWCDAVVTIAGESGKDWRDGGRLWTCIEGVWDQLMPNHHALIRGVQAMTCQLKGVEYRRQNMKQLLPRVLEFLGECTSNAQRVMAYTTLFQLVELTPRNDLDLFFALSDAWEPVYIHLYQDCIDGGAREMSIALGFLARVLREQRAFADGMKDSISSICRNIKTRDTLFTSLKQSNDPYRALLAEDLLRASLLALEAVALCDNGPYILWNSGYIDTILSCDFWKDNQALLANALSVANNMLVVDALQNSDDISGGWSKNSEVHKSVAKLVNSEGARIPLSIFDTRGDGKDSLRSVELITHILMGLVLGPVSITELDIASSVQCTGRLLYDYCCLFSRICRPTGPNNALLSRIGAPLPGTGHDSPDAILALQIILNLSMLLYSALPKEAVQMDESSFQAVGESMICTIEAATRELRAIHQYLSIRELRESTVDKSSDPVANLELNLRTCWSIIRLVTLDSGKFLGDRSNRAHHAVGDLIDELDSISQLEEAEVRCDLIQFESNASKLLTSLEGASENTKMDYYY